MKMFAIHLLFTVICLQIPTVAATDSNSRVDLAGANRLEKLYLNHAAPLSGQHSGEDLAIIMLFARHAQREPEGRISTYLAADLVPIFRSNPILFTQHLGQLPSLVGPVCNRLAAFFGTRPNAKQQQQAFFGELDSYLRANLSDHSVAQCAAEFPRSQ